MVLITALLGAAERTLLIITGSVRGSQIAHESLERHVLTPYAADLLLCTGVSSEHSSYLHQRARYLVEYPQVRDWRRVVDQVSYELFGHIKWRRYPLLGENLVGKYDARNHWTGIGSGFLTLYARYAALHWMEERGLVEQYDQFIITRSDFYYVADHPDPAELLSEQHHVAIPFQKSDHMGICDRHAVVDRVGLRAYLLALQSFLEYHPEYGPYHNNETVLNMALRKIHHIQPKRYLSPSYMVRADEDGTTTWSWGSRRDANGLWIKIEDEYEEAQRYLSK